MDSYSILETRKDNFYSALNSDLIVDIAACSGEAVSIIDVNYQLILHSPNQKKVFGDDDWTASSFERIHPDDLDEFTKYLGIAQEKREQIIAVRYRFEGKAKKEIWIETKIKFLPDFNGIQAYLLVSADVTDFINYQRFLVEKDNWFSEISKAIDDAVWVTDWKTRKTLYISPAYEKIYGQTCASLYNNSKSWADTIHPMDLLRVTQAYYQHAEEGTYDIEFRILKPDGSVTWVNEKAFPIFENGEIVRMAGITKDITKTKATELDLESHRKLMERGQTLSNIGTWESDLITGKISWSKEHYKIFGYPDENEEITAKKFFQHIIPEEREKVTREIKALTEKKDDYTLEFSIKTKDKKIKHVRTIAEVERDEYGKAIRSFGTLQDITAEKEKHKEDSFFRTILDGSYYAIYIVDLKSRKFVDTNKRATELSGFSRKELLKMGPADLVAEMQDENAFTEAIYTVRKKRQQTMRNNCIRKDKTTYPVEAAVSYAESNGKEYFIVVVRDLSEVEETKAALLKTESRFRHLFESMSEGILYSDKDGVIKLVNQGFCKITGYEAGELIGKVGYDILHTETEYQRLRAKLKERAEGVSENYDARLLRKNGKEIWINISASPDYDINGNFTGVMSLISDVTKEREAALRQEVVYNIARAANKRLPEIKYLAKLIHRELKKVLDAENFYLAIYDEAHNEITFPYWIDDTENVRKGPGKFKTRTFGKGLTELVISERKPVLINGNSKKEYKEYNLSKKLKCWLGVPIKGDGRVIGMMAIQSHNDTFAYSKDEERLMSFVAVQVGHLLERASALRQIVDNEERYRTLFEGNLAGVYRFSEEGVIIECNNAFAQMIGYKDKFQVIGKNISNLVVNLTDDNIYQSLRESGGTLKGLESQLLLKNGQDRWIIENSQMIQGNDGKLYMEGTIIDITEEKKARLIVEEEKLQGLQYQSMLLSSQINPHFIFNALNSVQFYILDQDTEPALNFVSDFSMLMRKVLSNSLYKYITIEDEIHFLSLYLELEKKRFRGKFNYSIEVSDEVDEQEFLIPPMLLQPYVENTIIHGIGNKATEGYIQIEFDCDEDNMFCTITDDGVGRERAKELKVLKKGPEHKSLGMGITSTRLDLLNKISANSYKVNVTDLFDDEGNGCGTVIHIEFPIITDDVKAEF